jgi:hypothetical protein
MGGVAAELARRVENVYALRSWLGDAMIENDHPFRFFEPTSPFWGRLIDDN